MKTAIPNIFKGIIIGIVFSCILLLTIPIVRDKITYRKWVNDLREMQRNGISPQTRGGKMICDTIKIR